MIDKSVLSVATTTDLSFVGSELKLIPMAMRQPLFGGYPEI
jgi:hypothetical protein